MSDVSLKSDTGQSLQLLGRCKAHILVLGISHVLDLIVAKGTKLAFLKVSLDVNALILDISFSDDNVNSFTDSVSASVTDQILTDYRVFSTEFGHCTKFKAQVRCYGQVSQTTSNSFRALECS